MNVTIQCQGELQILLKQREIQKKYWLYDVGVQCCCVYIGMYLKCVVVFHWNIFNIYIQLPPDYMLILFMETQWHKQSIMRIVKHRPYMHNENAKKLLK